MAEPQAESVGKRLVPLHRQPAPLQRHVIDHDVADHEHRHRKAGDGQSHDGAVEQRTCLPCSQHTQRDGNGDGDDQRRDRQRERGPHALLDQRRDRDTRIHGHTQITPQCGQAPAAELLQQRSVQAEVGTDACNVVRRGVVAGNDGCRVARRQMQQRKNEDSHHQHDGNDAEQTAQDVGQHLRVQHGPSMHNAPRSTTG